MDISPFIVKRSPFVWFRYRRPGSRKRYYEKTNIRKDADNTSLQIALAKNAIERRLLSEGPSEITDRGWAWVSSWLTSKYKATSKSLETYRIWWGHLSTFLSQNKINQPSQLTREHCFDYVEWRTHQVKRRSGKSPCINTALGELKLLAMAMSEAVSRGLAKDNPCRKLNIATEDTAIKPEITTEQEALIVAALKSQPAWMQLSFKVAMVTGLRFSETRLARSQVKWGDNMVLIEKPKGGHKRAFSIPIYTGLRPILETWFKGNSEYLWTMQGRSFPGLTWRGFFNDLGLYDISFHCTRVTFVTRGMRAGIPEPVMMRLVNHSSKLISRVYQRWSTSDLLQYGNLLSPQTASVATAGSPQETLGHATPETPVS